MVYDSVYEKFLRDNRVPKYDTHTCIFGELGFTPEGRAFLKCITCGTPREWPEQHKEPLPRKLRKGRKNKT